MQELVNNCEVISNVKLADSIYKLTLLSPIISNNARPGQFVNLRVNNCNDPLLRRPISISDINTKHNLFSIVYRVQGKGTKLLAETKAGYVLDVLGPLGNGVFPIEFGQDSSKPILVYLVGGGIGTPPLLFTAKKLFDIGINIIAILGFASKQQVILEKDFNNYAETVVYTEDGSYGIQGRVTDYFTENIESEASNSRNAIYMACGPTPMLSALQKNNVLSKLQGYLSLEEHMACGIGACMGCVCKVSTAIDWKYEKVCECGPVFAADKVVLK